MAAQAPPTHHVVPYAGIVTRAIALAIDAALVQAGLLVGAGMLFVVGELVGGIELGTAGKAVAGAAWAIATAGYFVGFWSLSGQTPGMRAMRLRLTTAAGAVPTPGRAVVRVLWLGLCIVPLFLGFLPVLFDERRRGVHDMLARTVVVYSSE
jgi:uncharacterized RDD family membrane protein YckC